MHTHTRIRDLLWNCEDYVFTVSIIVGNNLVPCEEGQYKLHSEATHLKRSILSSIALRFHYGLMCLNENFLYSICINL